MLWRTKHFDDFFFSRFTLTRTRMKTKNWFDRRRKWETRKLSWLSLAPALLHTYAYFISITSTSIQSCRSINWFFFAFIFSSRLYASRFYDFGTLFSVFFFGIILSSVKMTRWARFKQRLKATFAIFIGEAMQALSLFHNSYFRATFFFWFSSMSPSCFLSFCCSFYGVIVTRFPIVSWNAFVSLCAFECMCFCLRRFDDTQKKNPNWASQRQNVSLNLYFGKRIQSPGRT